MPCNLVLTFLVSSAVLMIGHICSSFGLTGHFLFHYLLRNVLIAAISIYIYHTIFATSDLKILTQQNLLCCQLSLYYCTIYFYFPHIYGYYYFFTFLLIHMLLRVWSFTYRRKRQRVSRVILTSNPSAFDYTSYLLTYSYFLMVECLACGICHTPQPQVLFLYF